MKVIDTMAFCGGLETNKSLYLISNSWFQPNPRWDHQDILADVTFKDLKTIIIIC